MELLDLRVASHMPICAVWGKMKTCDKPGMQAWVRPSCKFRVLSSSPIINRMGISSDLSKPVLLGLTIIAS